MEENIFMLPLKANIISKKISGNMKTYLIKSSLMEVKIKGYVTSYKQIGINEVKRCKGV